MTTLAQYVEGKRGEMARLSRESGVHYTTIWQIVKRGYRLSDYHAAKRLSDATGGEVSIEALCEPSDGVAPGTGTEG